MEDASDVFQGVTGRWTFLTQLLKSEESGEVAAASSKKIAATVFAIDSAEEIKSGIGRIFDSKKVIGER